MRPSTVLSGRFARMPWRATLRRISTTKRRLGWMLKPGDVVELDLGMPVGSEAGLRRPAIVVTAGRVLSGKPNVIQVVPLARTVRRSATEVIIDPDEENRLAASSSAQCQHLRSVAMTRVQERTGNVGPVVLGEVRETIVLLLDL